MSPTTVRPHDAAAVIDGPYAWMRLAVSLLFATIGGSGMWAVVVVLPAVQAEFGVDRAAASLPYTVTMIGFSAGSIVIGYAIDRWGYWRPAFAASIALSAGFWLAAASTSIAVFTILHGLLIGFGSSVIFGPLIADISHWFLMRRGLAVSVAAAGNYLAGVVWPLVMSFTMHAYGWRVTYAIIGTVCLATMLPLALLLRRPAPLHAAGTRGAARAVLPIRLSPAALQGLLVVAGVACCVAMSMPQVHLVAYCMDLGYGVARGTEMLSIMLFAGIFSRLVSGLLADRIGGIRTVLIGSVLQGLSLFLYIPFDGLAALYLVSLVFGLAQGGIVPAYAVIVREYMAPAEAGRRVGIVITATTAGMALGGWMSGWIYDLTGSYTAAFANGMAWNLLNVATMTFVLWRTLRPTTVQAASA